uniref:WbuC family cupin fold metalloprotein n=2 Tax=Proteus mirabilis TaxID=584 RepID=UPI002023FC60|nr:WbuC family cupin fold metalloprotein [Proteus mirabilis]EMA4724140.1 WbuC family cupin fold metalloprotein [Proteus mirabilis]MCL8621421.1 WbuC family cupin fold metalloprotein [Proteus mirabilis]MCL8632640.1 WbuC family cupin fold metalloprotein [Proteus mirabilis]HCT9451545.1 WbuC family cupin fold metalloprotein [Proteus mirabilis]HCT9715774.1 WbuC family cupin fold metalloprotein [Proteus mirabilis]
MKLLDENYLAPLFLDTDNAERKRSHKNLHNSFSDKVQRFFIALKKGSYVEPHYHALPEQWEMFIILKGTIKLTYYDNNGNIINQHLIGENEKCQVVEIAPLEIHSVECISDNALMLEIKEGPFSPEHAKVFPDFFIKKSS